MTKLTAKETASLEAIKSKAPVSVWVSNSAGRQWFAGGMKLSDATITSLENKGVIRHVFPRDRDICGTFVAI